MRPLMVRELAFVVTNEGRGALLEEAEQDQENLRIVANDQQEGLGDSDSSIESRPVMMASKFPLPPIPDDFDEGPAGDAEELPTETEEALEERKPMEEALKERKATEEVMEESKATEETLEDSKLTEEASEESKLTEEASEEPKGTEEASKEPKATEQAMVELPTNADEALEEPKATEEAEAMVELLTEAEGARRKMLASEFPLSPISVNFHEGPAGDKEELRTETEEAQEEHKATKEAAKATEEEATMSEEEVVVDAPAQDPKGMLEELLDRFLELKRDILEWVPRFK
ncbi:hypothetical protein L596_011495 [Steinernema carpocapsae]|uniref:Uncharacterized protein n=1 Tax=Steinernema carpocapsae TaxID=34508 RepID=A0A4U5NUI0_STECR|nr:hypothetical protein L596_011495 [Steinernema carpocapsae]